MNEGIKYRTFQNGEFNYWGVGDMHGDGSSCSFPSGKSLKLKHSQYTGLKDRNGVEIYEGDICQLWFLDVKEIIVSIVKRHGGYWHKRKKSEGYSNIHNGTMPYDTQEVLQKHYEVIGNIYKNPELIK